MREIDPLPTVMCPSERTFNVGVSRARVRASAARWSWIARLIEQNLAAITDLPRA
jgi:hypothetical protein